MPPTGSATSPVNGGEQTVRYTSRRCVLTVAEPSGWARHASVEVDGREVAPVADAPRPTYALPVGRHRLTIEVEPEHPWWRGLQGVAILVVAFLSIPFGTRAFRSRR